MSYAADEEPDRAETGEPTHRAEPTLASRALEEGRDALGRSFRFHRPRGPLCGRGYCAQCECSTSEGRVLACEVPADARAPAPIRDLLRPFGRDLLRPLGRIAEAWPPWFYERRFLRPRALQRPALELIRRLSAAPPLGPAAPLAAPRRFGRTEAKTVVVGDATEPEALHLDLARGDLVLGVYEDRRLGVLRGGALLEVAFERLVVATGSYERLPPIPGNDIPGVFGLAAFERYAAAGAFRPGTRVAAWTSPDRRERVHRTATRHGLSVVWIDEAAPAALEGRRRVEAVSVGDRIACDLFVVAVAQPSVELAVQAGARAELTAGELPILRVVDAPDWLELRGGSARTASGVPDVPARDEAFACLCEDVRVGDLRACVAQGFGDPELVKRRTGAMTGPCQGKLCAGAVLAALREAGVRPTPTRSRPLARPATLRELAANA